MEPYLFNRSGDGTRSPGLAYANADRQRSGLGLVSSPDLVEEDSKMVSS